MAKSMRGKLLRQVKNLGMYQCSSCLSRCLNIIATVSQMIFTCFTQLKTPPTLFESIPFWSAERSTTPTNKCSENPATPYSPDSHVDYWLTPTQISVWDMHFTPSPERNPSPVQRTSSGSEHTGSKTSKHVHLGNESLFCCPVCNDPHLIAKRKH